MRTSKLLKSVFANKAFNMFCQRFILRLDNLLYKILSSLVVIYSKGNHPKHSIMGYREWFLNSIKENSSVLDLGCGNGNMSYYVADKAKQVIAIDIVKENVAFAKKRHNHKNIEYLVGDATKFKFKRTFDYVMLSNVLEHIKNRVPFLKKIKPLANTFLIRVPMVNRDWVTVYKKKLGVEYRLDSTHFIEYTFEEFEDEIKKAGLKIQSFTVQFGEIWAVVK